MLLESEPLGEKSDRVPLIDMMAERRRAQVEPRLGYARLGVGNAHGMPLGFHSYCTRKTPSNDKLVHKSQI